MEWLTLLGIPGILTSVITFLVTFLVTRHFNKKDKNEADEKQEDKESSLNRADIQLGDSRRCRKQIPDSPRLTATFGNHPTGLSGNVSQRNRQ